MRGRKLSKLGLALKVLGEEIDNPRMRGRKHNDAVRQQVMAAKKLIIPG